MITERGWAVLFGLMMAVVALIGWAAEAHAHSNQVGVAVSCSVNEGQVTTIVRESGQVQRYTNLTIKQRRHVFPVADADMTNWAKRAGQPTIVKCVVQPNLVVRLRTAGGALWRVWQVSSPASPPLAPPHPVPVPPPVVGTWDGPVILAVSVDNTWDVAQAVAQWNPALPEDRRITVKTEPCAPLEQRCIPVSTADLPNGYWGMAYMSYADARMQACSIELSPATPLEYRSHISTHEIGHCLGLPHWDTVHSVMSTDAKTLQATSHDLAWLSNAYAATP